MEAIRQPSIPSTASISLASDVNLEDEGDSEGSEEEIGLPAQFIIKIGTQDYRVKAYKDFWALQKWVEYTSKETGVKVVRGFQSFKYFANLGQLANRVFDFRLKNSDVDNLNELTETARKLVIDIKKEFEVNLK